jgi:hypothetical protein
VAPETTPIISISAGVLNELVERQKAADAAGDRKRAGEAAQVAAEETKAIGESGKHAVGGDAELDDAARHARRVEGRPNLRARCSASAPWPQRSRRSGVSGYGAPSVRQAMPGAQRRRHGRLFRFPLLTRGRGDLAVIVGILARPAVNRGEPFAQAEIPELVR